MAAYALRMRAVPPALRRLLKPLTEHAGGGTRGRTPRAPLLLAKGGASDTMDKGVFFFAERSTTLERSVRSVTVGQERSRG